MKDRNALVVAPTVSEADVARHAAAIETAWTIRLTEERLLELFKQGKIFGTVHTCLGQEFTGIAVAQALKEADWVLSNHRCHGHYIARTGDVGGLIAEVMGKETGVCGGRGGSQHLCRETFLSNGVQGGMGPVAAGLALAAKLRGEKRVVVLFVGDGTLGEGALYEALNLMSHWQLPVLVLLENNGYAQSTAQGETTAGDICARAQAFGIASDRASTWEWPELIARTAAAVERIRATGQPRFLQVDTYRLGPHSKGDDNRDPAEIASFVERDPLNQLASVVPNLDAVRGAIATRLDGAVAAADAASTQALVRVAETPVAPSWSALSVPEERIVKLIRGALADAMAADERVVLLGEDVKSPYGGAFKATQGLSDAHPDRVFNTPISEAAIVGVGSGLALAGRRPVVEIMFGDFVMLAADQLVNHASKFQWMYNDQVRVPLIVRTPMGGRRGYGPTHSQTLEKHLLGIPGLQILNVHPRYSPAELYRDLFATIDRPTLVVENKMLYGQMAGDKVTPGFVLERTQDIFPTVRIRPADATPDVTFVVYGGMVQAAEAALVDLFQDHEVVAEILIPTRLYPLDPAPIVESVARSGRLVVAEEGQGFAGFGAELVAQLVEQLSGRFRARRVAAAPHPIPTSRPLEELSLPDASSLVRAALEITHG